MPSSVEAVTKWRNVTKDRMVAAMGGSCAICGYNKCNRALDFHHVDASTKDFGFATVRANPTSWKLIVEELRKCVCLCKNCHMEVHAGVAEVPENYPRFDEAYADYRPKVPEKPRSTRKRFDWSQVDLPSLLQTNTVSAIARTLGITETAVRKRMANIPG